MKMVSRMVTLVALCTSALGSGACGAPPREEGQAGEEDLPEVATDEPEGVPTPELEGDEVPDDAAAVSSAMRGDEPGGDEDPEEPEVAVALARPGPVHHLLPGQDVRAAFQALRAGDTLLVHPGTYFIGGIAPTLAPGTAARRITVRAADVRRPPLFRGYLVLHDADFWTFSDLRIQATLRTKAALFMAGGQSWIVTRSELFGASSTGSYANVAIANGVVPPRDWLFTGNCVHDAGRGNLPGHGDTDHNIYVNASGSAPGVISRNILFNATSGSNVKVGNGGNAKLAGASNVQLRYNTTYNAFHQFLIFGNLTGIDLRGNLEIRSTGRTPVGIYLASLSHPNAARATHNYAYLMTKNVWAPSSPPGTYTLADDPIFNDRAGHDPLIVSGCGGFHPKNRLAARYGRYSTVAY